MGDHKLVGKCDCTKCGKRNVTLHPGLHFDWRCYHCKAILAVCENPLYPRKNETQHELKMGDGQ